MSETNHSLFTPDFRQASYWLDATPPPDLSGAALPERADAVIVGSGYTGLNAAIELARAGRDTVVIDAEAAGWGCSTRNGGQVADGIKPDFDSLATRYGAGKAHAIIAEGLSALGWVGETVSREKIECDFKVCGRFHAAHSPRAYQRLERWLERRPADLRVGEALVSRADQHREVASDAYFGGMIEPRDAALDPARFHRGLLDTAQAAGVRVVPQCRATAIAQDGGRTNVATTRGTVAARDVLVATNGYTGDLVPWLRRRIVPIGSYIIATEAVGRETMAAVLPGGRVVSDTRKVIYYYRASPDGTRMLFGGRVSAGDTDTVMSAGRLRDEMVRLFPQLANARVARSWMGFVAFTFDILPHVGAREGIHYAMGYCGSGIAMASWLGMKAGLRMLGRTDGRTAFDDVPMRSRAYYFRRPWFVAPAIRYYRLRDRLG